MSNNNNINSEDPEEAKEENIFQKNWNDFSRTIQTGFKKFQDSIQEQAAKNEEFFKKNSAWIQEQVKNNKEKFDTQLNKWSSDLKKLQYETTEQWQSRTSKIKQDFEQWQEQSRKDFKKGIKSFERGFYKWYFIFLLMIIPILVIVVVVVVLITRLVPS